MPQLLTCMFPSVGKFLRFESLHELRWALQAGFRIGTFRSYQMTWTARLYIVYFQAWYCMWWAFGNSQYTNRCGMYSNTARTDNDEGLIWAELSMRTTFVSCNQLLTLHVCISCSVHRLGTAYFVRGLRLPRRAYTWAKWEDQILKAGNFKYVFTRKRVSSRCGGYANSIIDSLLELLCAPCHVT